VGGVHKDLRPFAVVYLYVMPFAFALTALGVGLMIWVTRHSFAAPEPRRGTGVDHLVALLQPGAAPDAEPEVEYQIVDLQWSSYLTQPVQAYFDPEPAGPVVLRSANGLLWPHAVRRIESQRGGLQDR
jgi:hypothetical protein